MFSSVSSTDHVADYVSWPSWRLKWSYGNLSFISQYLDIPDNNTYLAHLLRAVFSVSAILKKRFASKHFLFCLLHSPLCWQFDSFLALKWHSTFEKTGQYYRRTDHLLASGWKIGWWWLSKELEKYLPLVSRVWISVILVRR